MPKTETTLDELKKILELLDGIVGAGTASDDRKIILAAEYTSRLIDKLGGNITAADIEWATQILATQKVGCEEHHE
jgi:hypothetical protein